jgi:hypothetical protein
MSQYVETHIVYSSTFRCNATGTLFWMRLLIVCAVECKCGVSLLLYFVSSGMPTQCQSAIVFYFGIQNKK